MKISNDFLNRVEQFDKKFNIKSDEENNNTNQSFGQILKGYIDDVNQLNVETDSLTNSFVKNEDGVNIEDVMLKASEATLGLQFLTTTRDKLLDGYKELIKMQ